MIYKTTLFLTDLSPAEKAANCYTQVIVTTPHAGTAEAIRYRLESAGFKLGRTVFEDMRFHTSPDLPQFASWEYAREDVQPIPVSGSDTTPNHSVSVHGTYDPATDVVTITHETSGGDQQ